MTKLICVTIAAFSILAFADDEIPENSCRLQPSSADLSHSLFLCTNNGAAVKFICDLSGEGGNAPIGTLVTIGSTAQIEFKAADNNGNEGTLFCDRVE